MIGPLLHSPHLAHSAQYIIRFRFLFLWLSCVVGVAAAMMPPLYGDSSKNQISTTSSLMRDHTPMKRRAHSAGRREGGSLLTEPCLGQDSFYDGVYERDSIAFRCGSRGGKYAQGQAYSAAFKSNVKRPWNRPATRESKLVPVFGEAGGPLHYNPYGSQTLSDATHSFAGSLVWSQRGRAGPIGTAWDGLRRSPSFASDVPKLAYTSSGVPARRSLDPRHDCFLLKSDYGKESIARNEVLTGLQTRVGYGHLPPQRPMSAINW